MYRWFRDAVGDERYLRRWKAGESLPGEDNWEAFCRALLSRAGAEVDSRRARLVELNILLANARREARVSPVAVAGHTCIRRAVKLRMDVSPLSMITETTLTIESLVNGLDQIHHGVVIADPHVIVNLTTSTVEVESLSPERNIWIEDTASGTRSFQFSARLSPALTVGERFEYRYRHRCDNYYAESTRRDRAMSVPRWQEKSYTITVPTDLLQATVELNDRRAIQQARVEAALWKSEQLEELETRRLRDDGALAVTTVNGHPAITLVVRKPVLHVRYRLFWR